MVKKKYVLVKTKEKTLTGKSLFRVKAVRSFSSNVKKGELGGFIEKRRIEEMPDG